MSFIEVAIADAKAPEVQPEGVYDLVIEKADMYKKDGSTKTSVRCIIGFDGVPGAASIFHYQSLPGPDDDSEKVNNKLLMLKRFLEAFYIPFEGNGFAVEDCVGARGRFFITQEPDQNNIPRNVLTFKKVA